MREGETFAVESLALPPGHELNSRSKRSIERCDGMYSEEAGEGAMYDSAACYAIIIPRPQSHSNERNVFCKDSKSTVRSGSGTERAAAGCGSDP